MNDFAVLRNRSHYSLQTSPAKPEDIIARASDVGFGSVALSDIGGISGVPEFFKLCKKPGIKPLAAIQIQPSNAILIATNLVGWKNLIKITSIANLPGNILAPRKGSSNFRPAIYLKQLDGSTDGIICISGNCHTDISDVIFTDANAAYRAKTAEGVKQYINPDWVADATGLINIYLSVFRKENLYIEVNSFNGECIPAIDFVSKGMRYIANKLKIATVAAPDVYYPNHANARDQQIILCNSLKTNLVDVYKKLAEGDDPTLGGFFVPEASFHIPTLQEILKVNTETEIRGAIEIAERCEAFDVNGPPIMPRFNCPGGMPEMEYLKKLCREGWKKLNIDSSDKRYLDRINMEFKVIQDANLAGYFLVVWDYTWDAKRKGEYADARGSGGGCLVSYLIGLTSPLLDPIKYDLSFERFYNAGRNTKDRVSLPDIDIDFEVRKRDERFEYIKNKYGKDKFGHICTFTRLKGRNALKDVLRVTNACDPSTMDAITNAIPDESKISDELQEMEEAGEDPSIIMWSLENRSAELSKYCIVNDKGELHGEYARQFQQAMRLENVKRNMSKHAAGIVITDIPLAEIVPMCYYKGSPDEPIIGYDMKNAEAVGIVKYDILSVNNQDKKRACVNTINQRKYGIRQETETI